MATQTQSAEYERALSENERYVAQFDRSNLPLPPGRKLAVLACMDARLTVEDVLGLRTGDAHIIRNAGGLASDDALRSLVISQRLLGTEEVIVLEHTGCGMLTFDDDEVRADIAAETGADADVRFGAFHDLEDNLRSQVDPDPRPSLDEGRPGPRPRLRGRDRPAARGGLSHGWRGAVARSGRSPPRSGGLQGPGATPSAAQALGDRLCLDRADPEATERVAGHLHAQLELALDGLDVAADRAERRHLAGAVGAHDERDTRVDVPCVMDDEARGVLVGIATTRTRAVSRLACLSTSMFDASPNSAGYPCRAGAGRRAARS